jgi:hypothetical protein
MRLFHKALGVLRALPDARVQSPQTSTRTTGSLGTPGRSSRRRTPSLEGIDVVERAADKKLRPVVVLLGRFE